MRTTCGTILATAIVVCAAIAADGQSGAAETFPLPPKATAVGMRGSDPIGVLVAELIDSAVKNEE
jgi:hypothetical protein